MDENVKAMQKWPMYSGAESFEVMRVSDHQAVMVGFERAIRIVKDCCDRDWTNETAEQVAAIASNAMFWRNDEIRRLRDELNTRAPSRVPAPDPVCEQLYALMELACADIIFFHPFVGPETPELPAKVAFSVMVNDLFVPAADAEGFDITEAIPLRDVFRKDGYEGVVRWVQAKRDNMPLRPHVEKRIKEKERAPEPVREKLIEALKGMRDLFDADKTAFYIAKAHGGITNGDQTQIDNAFIQLGAALKLAEESKP